MGSRIRVRSFDAILVITAGIIILYLAMHEAAGLGWDWENARVHHLIEALSAMAGAVAAMILLTTIDRAGGGKRYFLALGLLGMSTLDFVAAHVEGPGTQAAISGAGSLVAAVFFALVWLPAAASPFARRFLTPLALVLGTFLAGLLIALIAPDAPVVPTGPRAVWAWPIAASAAAGVAFSAAAARFVIDYHGHGNGEPFVFALVAGLMAVAVLAGLDARPWSEDWWIVHFLKLAVGLLALAYAISSVDRVIERMRTALAEKEAAVRDLAGTEAKLRHIAEHSVDAIWTATLDGRFTYVSGAVARIRGFTPDEAMGQTFEDVLPPDSLVVAMEGFAEEMALEGREGVDPGRSRTFDLEQYCKDGSTVWTETTSTFLRDGEGKPNGILGITRDVSGRRKAEEERRRQEARLAESQKLESIGRLAGGVAHDFNNLLLVVMSNAEFLEQDLPAGDPRLGDVTEIKKAARRAADLTKHLLAFSRKQPVSPRILEVGQVVGDVDRMLRRTIGEDVAFRTSCRRDVWNVRFDPVQFHQVLVNLALNARDAMPSGGEIRIEAFNCDTGDGDAGSLADLPPGRYVCIAVSDTGTGMAEDVKAHAFEPFFTTKEVGRGTGLGLSTVYGLVMQAGGHVHIDTEPGIGTSVQVYLPATTDPPDHEERSAMAPRPTGTGGAILLVEDDDAVRRMTERILSQGGFEVVAVEGGAEALAAADALGDRLDLLVTDVVMPGMSGREIALRLRRIRQDLKVLYMSGYTQESIGAQGILDEGVDLIQKPFTSAALLSVIGRVLERWRGPTGPASSGS